MLLPPLHIAAGVAVGAVGAAMAGQLIVVVAVLVLFAGVGSVTPLGVATVATFVMVVVVAPAVPVTVKVTLPPLGKVGIANVPACNDANVGLAGQAAPPVAVLQVILLAVKFTTDGSLTVALFAGAGPLFVTTNA